ncbi:hypothetical protein Tco_1523297 [Tanacetum coccineum]
MTPYTGYPDVEGIIYQDELNKNRLIRTDELHKFSDVTLNHVHTTLNDIATRIQMDYFPKRRWSPQDKRRARVMISAIDKKLRDRRLMRILEKFVGGRPFYTSARNPVKEILLKLNLPDHRILKDGGEDFRYSDTERLSRSDEVLKVKNFKKDATLKLSKSTNQEWGVKGGTSTKTVSASGAKGRASKGASGAKGGASAKTVSASDAKGGASKGESGAKGGASTKTVSASGAKGGASTKSVSARGARVEEYIAKSCNTTPPAQPPPRQKRGAVSSAKVAKRGNATSNSAHSSMNTQEEMERKKGEGITFMTRKSVLYLTRRSLEVLKKFHWTTLGGRSNQLSYVSSPLLSKSGEY